MLSRAHRTGQGGAAMVEFALSALLLVPLLVASMYVGELFSAAAKAQEAEVSTAWEVTGHLLHDYQNGASASSYGPVLYQAAHRVADRLQDLDSFQNNGNTGRPLAFQRVTPPTVSCQLQPAPDPDLVAFTSLSDKKVNDPGDPWLINQHSAREYLHPDASYLGCRAKVSVVKGLAGFDASLAPYDQGLSLLPGVGPVISFCGLGASLHGCAGGRWGALLLTDDWAVESGRSNAVGTRDNARYYNLAQAVYGGGMAHRVIEDGMRALLGLGDQGALSGSDQEGSVALRLGLYDRVSDYHVVPSEVGNSGATVNAHRHLTPYDTDSGLPRAAHLARKNGRYLGQPSPTFNQP